MNKISKLALGCLFSLGIISCSGGSNSADQERIAQLEAQIAELQSKQNVEETQAETETETVVEEQVSTQAKPSTTTSKSNDLAGTYEFTDEANHTWVIKLNSDGTTTIQLKDSDNLAYGKWDDYTHINGNIGIVYPDDQPRIVFPKGEEKSRYLQINDGFVYYLNYASSKNPNWRLPIRKVK